MSKMIELNPEQTRAYNRYIMARDKVNKKAKNWVRASDISHTVDIVGLNHPLYVVNDVYVEYVEAFKQWLAVEPVRERMSMIRGDYDKQDSWKGDK